MIEATYGVNRHCTGCGKTFHMSENNAHLKCGDGVVAKAAPAEAKPVEKKSVKPAKKSK